MTGINFNNSVGQLTVYIDEIYLTNTVPEGYENNGSTPVTPPTTGSGNDTNSAPENNNGSGNNAANQNNTNTPSAGGSASSGMSTRKRSDDHRGCGDGGAEYHRAGLCDPAAEQKAIKTQEEENGMKTKWMKALAGGCAAVLMLPSMLASARTDDAVVFADFEGTGTPAVGRSCRQ